MPEGIVWSTNFSRPTTTVWPALLPPWTRTTTSKCGAITSTTLPLPSSPHWAPTITMLGMTRPSHVRKLAAWVGQDLGRRHAPLAALVVQRNHPHLLRVRTGLADHERPPGALLPRVIERCVEPSAQDVSRHCRAEVSQAPR